MLLCIGLLTCSQSVCRVLFVNKITITYQLAASQLGELDMLVVGDKTRENGD